MDQLARFYDFQGFLLERVSTRQEAFDSGVAYLDEEHPERYYANFLLVQGRSDATAEMLAGVADRILGGADLRHRLVLVNDEPTAAALGPGFAALGYSPSWSVLMAHRHGPDRGGQVPVEEVPFAEVRALIRETYLEDPAIPDELAHGFTEQQGKRERTIGARFFVGNVDGQSAGTCELYLEGAVAQVENVGTLERFRGRGVARSVVLRAVEVAREAGARDIFIEADEDDWPKDLYARLGFERIGRSGEFLRAPA